MRRPPAIYSLVASGVLRQQVASVYAWAKHWRDTMFYTPAGRAALNKACRDAACHGGSEPETLQRLIETRYLTDTGYTHILPLALHDEREIAFNMSALCYSLAKIQVELDKDDAP